ncbi:MAG: hypothetical protein OQK59_03860 [Chlorobium sp.]|nr:hypothetical protein [Chlorobium sp.]MCW8820409.1 hypothetical protein [Ignavibacteriaceae bacterium]
MATISTYVSGHAEAGDIAEFFQKQLLNAGERPIAFFDGVFYESHQERVGNIAFQDYLIYSDRAVYLWARGANKDYLDRFALGAVSINSRNKDNDFATLNLRIRREGKEPVYVIFDMVEIAEAEKISTLHTIIESTIENYLGNNFREEIPDQIAEQIFASGVNICPPSPLSFSPSAGQASVQEQNSRIGYGQDLLEQYKTSMGFSSGSPSEARPPRGPSFTGGAAPQQSAGTRRPSMPGIPKEIEGLLPTDPEALKRIAGNLKDMVGEAPFRFRDQVMKDLQNVPGDVATVLKAVNELVSNISDNPQAEKFVLTAIQTAVKNDGILGSVGKMIKMTQSFGPMGNKPGGQQSSGGSSAAGGNAHGADNAGAQSEDDYTGTTRRKKLKIHMDNEEAPGGVFGDSFDQVLPDIESGISSAQSGSSSEENEAGVHRKKVTIIADVPEESESGIPLGSSHQEQVRKKVSSVEDSGSGKAASEKKEQANTETEDIPQALEEQLRDALVEAEDTARSEPDSAAEVDESQVVRKKISIQHEEADESQVEEKESRVYRTIESEARQDETQEGKDRQKKPEPNSILRGSHNKKANNQG